MTVAKVGRALAGLTLLVAASACDNNPLAEDRDKAAYFRLNPSNVAVQAGGTVHVEANVLNKYGATTGQTVTATPCDAKITAVADPSRSEFEYPERFLVTAGNTIGTSCMVVSGGGITDTVDVRIVPAAVDVELAAPADTLLESGDIVNLPIVYLNVDDDPITVPIDARTTFTVVTAAVGVVDGEGNFTARAPGTTWIRATFTDLGVTRRDSVQVRVIAAPFTGSAAQIAYGGGQVIEFTAGGIPFDANTRVEFPGRTGGTFVHLMPNTGNTIRAAIPSGTAAGTVITYNILNAGPNEATVSGTFTTTALAPASDPFVNQTLATARTMAVGEDMFGTILGVRGSSEVFQVTVAEAGTYRIAFQWADANDKDAYVLDAAGDALLALENAAATNPETGTVELEPGTYYLVGQTWTPATGGGPVYYRMRFTRED